MAERDVHKSGKGRDGDITSLCSDGAYWSPREKADVIRDIESGLHRYHVPWTDGLVEIRCVDGPAGTYLRADHDATPRNNLLDLPDC